jgi:hypothetical protein
MTAYVNWIYNSFGPIVRRFNVFVVAHAVMKALDASRQEERLHGRYQLDSDHAQVMIKVVDNR